MGLRSSGSSSSCCCCGGGSSSCGGSSSSEDMGHNVRLEFKYENRDKGIHT